MAAKWVDRGLANQRLPKALKRSLSPLAAHRFALAILGSPCRKIGVFPIFAYEMLGDAAEVNAHSTTTFCGNQVL
jgi:hypothetical protein